MGEICNKCYIHFARIASAFIDYSMTVAFFNSFVVTQVAPLFNNNFCEDNFINGDFYCPERPNARYVKKNGSMIG